MPDSQNNRAGKRQPREFVIFVVAIGGLAVAAQLRDLLAAALWVVGMFGGWYVGVSDD